MNQNINLQDDYILVVASTELSCSCVSETARGIYSIDGLGIFNRIMKFYIYF